MKTIRTLVIAILTSYVFALMALADIPCDFTDGLVAYYTFNGDANDESGNGNDGVLHGVTLTADRHGNADGAYHFDGTSAYIEVPDSDSLREVDQSVTLSAWVNICGWGGTYKDWASIICKGTVNGSRQYGMQISNLGKWGFAQNEVTNIKAPATNVWCHVAMTYTPTLLSAYLDGELVGTMIPSGSIIDNVEALYIGIDIPGTVEYFVGDMDEVRIYNRTLSSSEVRALANDDNPTASVIGDNTNVYRYDICDGVGIMQTGVGTVDSLLDISSTIDSKPVIAIGRYAFADCCDIVEVVIPASVLEIGDCAFAGCANLSQVTISGDIGTLTVGGNAFDSTTEVVIGQKDGYYFGGWTNATGVIISDPFHSETPLTVSPRWMAKGAEYEEHLIFFEDFERETMEFELETVGTFPNPASIQDGMGVGGTRGFGFGRSDCTGSAWENYMNTLTAKFNYRYFITKVEFEEMERYGNFGSKGHVFVNRDNDLWEEQFCRLPTNDKIADSEFRHRNIEVCQMATNISLQVWDITNVSEEFVDNVKIYGRLARKWTIALDANGGSGVMNAQEIVEGDVLTLAPNYYVRGGYLFQGWSTAADGAVEYADGATILELPADKTEVTLYAVWKLHEPVIVGDDNAEITGDEDNGYTVKPSAETANVEVMIPEEVSADKVTIQVTASVDKVKTNGAIIQVMSGGHDVSEYVQLPEAGTDGFVDLREAVVKPEIVEALLTEDDAEVSIGVEEPVIRTAETKLGLTYHFREGTTLEAMKADEPESKDGDGQAWEPTITVKGADSAFYELKITW